MTQGEVQTLEQTRADRQTQFLQPLGATAHAVHYLLQTPLALLFDHLAIDQIGMGLLKWLLRASRLSRAREGLQRMVDRKQSRQITAKAITEKARDPQDRGSRHPYEGQGTGKRPWTNKRGQDKSKLGGEADPHPLPPVCTPLTALAIRTGLLGMLTSDEAPHLIELHLGNGQVPQQVGIDLMSLLCGSSQPLQDGFFRHTQDKANIRQADFDQEHLQRHHDLVFRGPQIKKDRVARLGKAVLTFATAEDAPFAALSQIGGDGTYVASVHQPIMRTVRVGARLAPVLGFSHGPNLPIKLG